MQKCLQSPCWEGSLCLKPASDCPALLSSWCRFLSLAPLWLFFPSPLSPLSLSPYPHFLSSFPSPFSLLWVHPQITKTAVCLGECPGLQWEMKMSFEHTLPFCSCCLESRLPAMLRLNLPSALSWAEPQDPSHRWLSMESSKCSPSAVLQAINISFCNKELGLWNLPFIFTASTRCLFIFTQIALLLFKIGSCGIYQVSVCQRSGY